MKRKKISSLDEINTKLLLSLDKKIARKIVYKMLKNEIIDYKLYKQLMDAIVYGEPLNL
jgi:hypothetical protein